MGHDSPVLDASECTNAQVFRLYSPTPTPTLLRNSKSITWFLIYIHDACHCTVLRFFTHRLVCSVTFSPAFILADTGVEPFILPYFERNPFYLELDGINRFY